MAQNDNVQYTYISQLGEAQKLLSSDLFVISQISNEIDNTYASYSVKYDDISSNISSALYHSMSSMTDLAISSFAEGLAEKIVELSSKIDICLSACVALDNCRSLFKAAVVQAFLENGFTNLTALTSDDGQTDQTDNT